MITGSTFDADVGVHRVLRERVRVRREVVPYGRVRVDVRAVPGSASVDVEHHDDGEGGGRLSRTRTTAR